MQSAFNKYAESRMKVRLILSVFNIFLSSVGIALAIRQGDLMSIFITSEK